MSELLNDIYFEEEIQRDKNRKALLLAQTRFAAQIKPFIDGKPERLSYVETELHRIIVEAVAATDADESYVSDRFRAYVAEAVAVSEPEHMELEEGREDSYPPKKNDPAAVDPEPDATTSVLDFGDTVLEDEILEPDAKIDLSTAACFRCNAKLNPVVAAASKVCLDCGSELAKLADASPLALAPNGVQPGQPVDPNARVTCPYCSAKGYHWEGNQTEYQQHVTQQHQQELNQVQQMQTLPVSASKLKFAAPEDVSPPNPSTPDVSADEGLSEQGNPVHHFDDVVQQLANNAAAIQFSQASDQDLQSIAQRYGVDPQTIKDKVFVTAEFGDAKAANGTAADSIEPPDGYSQVDLEGTGTSGQAETHDAQVPYNLARDKVAADLKMQPDLIDNMLTDAYGGQLGDQYHASVSGQRSFYLPQDMVGAAQEQEQPQPQQQQQNQQVGPTPQPVAPQPQSSVVRVSLADLIEADRRRRR